MWMPKSQSELIRTARGERSQADFSKMLGCDRSCLSRYEHETLGAPPQVITRCLQIVATMQQKSDLHGRPFDRALDLARQAVAELESLQAPSSSGRTER